MSQHFYSLTTKTPANPFPQDIDSNLSPAQLDAAATVLASEARTEGSETLHPSISTSYEPSFSLLINSAHSQLESEAPPGDPKSGIDLSRYEEPSAPTSSSDREAWRTSLRAAYISQAYLTERQLNLSLLDKYGKNAWLIGNSQVEEQLGSLEKELADVKRELEIVEEERRQRQEGVRGEIEGLEQSWRATVGRAIEAEVAAEGLRKEVLRRRRGGT